MRDRTHDVQIEAMPPAASSPARLFHTEADQKLMHNCKENIKVHTKNVWHYWNKNIKFHFFSAISFEFNWTVPEMMITNTCVIRPET